MSKEFDFEGIGMEFDHAFGWYELKWNLLDDLESTCLVGRM